MKDARFSSKAYGTHDFKAISIEGRVQFDLYQAIQRDHKLSSYSLNSVSAHFLGEQKEDVHHSDISKLQDGNAETRRRLAIYCLKVSGWEYVRTGFSYEGAAGGAAHAWQQAASVPILMPLLTQAALRLPCSPLPPPPACPAGCTGRVPAAAPG